MNKKIRNYVFETNSSSVHTLSVSRQGIEPSKFVLDEEGYLHTDFGTFGKNYDIFDSQYDKLSYLITLCYYCAGFEIESIRESYQFKYIEDAMKKHTGCLGIIIDGLKEPEIDHQSQPYDGNIDIINIYDEDEIINFVFNKYISLKTDCD